MIDKYLEDIGLSSTVNEEGKKYIAECIAHTEAMTATALAVVSDFSDEITRTKELLNEADKELCGYFEGLASLVKKYNDSLRTDSIWSTVDESDRQKKLATYYSFAARIEKEERRKPTSFPSTDDISELYSRSLIDLERVRLLKIAYGILKKDDSPLLKMYSIYNSSAKRIDELARHSHELLCRIGYNEFALGKYLSQLKNALDEENKGLNMNISAARNCSLSFLSNLIIK